MARVPFAASAAPASPASDELPAGTTLRPLLAHCDARGVVAEFYRGEWSAAAVAQWTLTVSEAGVLRGAHAHLRRHDYLVVIDGRCSIGLHDLRPGSPSAGRSVLLEMCGEQPAALTIPPGVVHGLNMHTRTIYALGLSEYYDPEDELGCHWRDSDLGIDWPVAEAQLSARDAALPPLRDIRARIPPWTAG